MENKINKDFMQIAIKESLKAYKKGDVPVGAIIVRGNKIIAKAHNKKNKSKNATYHAEVLAINKACKKVKNFRLSGCELYVTKEPCLMCLGAILSARIDKVFFGSYDNKFGNLHVLNDVKFNHSCEFVGGVCEDENSQILSSFFSELRSLRK